MGMFDSFKARKALIDHRKGNIAAARAAYEALYADGFINASYMISWSYILLREGGEENYKKVKEILVKAQKDPTLTEQQRGDLLVNFAVADYKLGNTEKAVELLERVHQKTPKGETYGALGYVLIEQGDAEKALAFNEAALEYDDEDPVILDNLGQIHYRLLNNKEKALEYFNRAHELKPGQIDTLWFLSRYDLEAGKKDDAIEKLTTALEGRFSPLNYVTKATVEEEISRLRG
ncbi:MAG: tetratricopeptide repeat protein [Clostridia bacterium]|nr:tetratricopeptide repeat protein [Clostridia bacterium]